MSASRLFSALLVGGAVVFMKRVAFISAFGSGESKSLGLRLADSAGAGALGRNEISLLTAVVLVYCFVLGLVSHLALGSKGLGRGANGSVAFLGVLATVFVYTHLWGLPVADDLAGLAGASIAISTLAIIIAAFVKMFVMNGIDSYAAGNKPSFSAKAAGRGARGPSTDRVNMALKR